MKKNGILDLFFSSKTKLTAKTVTECSHITLECQLRAQNDCINVLHLIQNKKNTFMTYKGVKNEKKMSKCCVLEKFGVFSALQNGLKGCAYYFNQWNDRA